MTAGQDKSGDCFMAGFSMCSSEVLGSLCQDSLSRDRMASVVFTRVHQPDQPLIQCVTTSREGICLWASLVQAPTCFLFIIQHLVKSQGLKDLMLNMRSLC